MKATIRKESMRISNSGAGESAIQHRFNSRFDFENIKIILTVFVLLEILDAALTFSGISQRGLIFEKNLFIRSLIENFGFIPVAAAKIIISGIFALLINYLCNKFENYRKFLFYLSILLLLVAFYGVGSSAYVLFFYP